MSGEGPNEQEGMSQDDIDAALNAAGTGGASAADDASAAGAPAGDAAAPEASAPDTAGDQHPAEEGTSEDAPAAHAGDDPQEATEPPVSAEPQDEAAQDTGSAGSTQADIDAAMMEAAVAEEQAAAAAGSASGASPAAGVDLSTPPANAVALDLPNLDGSAETSGGKGIELLNDVELDVKIELGRTQMFIEDVLKLGEGAVVELDKLAGDPVDVLVNEKVVARGEVLVLNDNFCVRISEIVAAVKGANES